MPNIKSIEKEVEYEFRKWKKQLLILDKVLSVLAVLLLGVFRPDYVVIVAFLLVFPYLILTQRKVLFYHLMLSFAVALIWMLIANNQYSYNKDLLTFAGINLHPLFSWALGLFTIYVIYSHYEYILKKQNFVRKLLLFMAFYLPVIIVTETIAYHVFDIQNVAAASYNGLWLCDCIHAPPWMQAAYLLLGPIFFSIIYLLRLENPHIKVKKSKHF